MAIEFGIKSKVSTLGDRKGQTVYYAWPKMNQHMTNDEVIEHIVDATSLAKGDVKNALASLTEVVNEALSRGSSVDLAELGSLRVVVSSKMMDTPEEVTVANALKTPKITFTPKSEMLAAAKSVKLSIDHSAGVTAASSGDTTADKDTEPGAETGGEEG